MVDVQEIKAYMARRNYTQRKLADELGIAEQTLARKFRSGVFRTNEIESLISILGIHNPTDVFFAPKVTQEVT